jgi:hypothetical protein
MLGHVLLTHFTFDDQPSSFALVSLEGGHHSFSKVAVGDGAHL